MRPLRGKVAQLQTHLPAPNDNFGGIGSPEQLLLTIEDILKKEKTAVVTKEGDETGVCADDVIVAAASGCVVAVVTVESVEVISKGLGVCSVNMSSQGVKVSSGSVAVDQCVPIRGGELIMVGIGLLKYISDLVQGGG